MLKAVIIDDEPNNVDNLCALLRKYCPLIEIAGMGFDATSGLEIITKQQPDLVFLDIEMPDKTGFDMLRMLAAYDFEVIIVTAYGHYSLQAIKFAAIDYLLKPVNPFELKQAVDKVLAKNQQKKHNSRLEHLVALLDKNKDHKLALPSLTEIRLVTYDQIIRCEATNNYTTFHLTTEEAILVSRPIYEYDKLLSVEGFVRTHQSHLVNVSHIKSLIKTDGGYLKMSDNTSVPISRLKKAQLLMLLNNHRG